MSERIPNKKQNFDGIDPQESLIKSLESIKSLLKQGDSKINAARKNIARADSFSSDTIENRLNDQSSEIPDNTFQDSNSINESDIIEIPVEQELNESIESEIEEIIVEAIPENTIFNTNATTTKAAIELKPTVPNVEPTTSPVIDSPTENTTLNDLYDHDLIVPMLDEIVIPEDQDSSLFNMDSSVEIKIDSALFELGSDNQQLNGSDTNSKLANDDFIGDDANNSTYNTIKKSDNKTNADIISFELSSNAKKNNLKKIEDKNALSDKSTLDIPEVQKNISQIEDSQAKIKLNTPNRTKNKPSIEQVVIKETTLKKQQLKSNASLVNEKFTEIKSEAVEQLAKPIPKNSQVNLSSAIASATYTDDTLNKITNSNNNVTTKKSSNQNPDQEIDFSKIDGLDRLNFNADKMSTLQKRVEKRVHNRLIQLIVQLDDEIKNIFTDEIKNCIAQEVDNHKNEK